MPNDRPRRADAPRGRPARASGSPPAPKSAAKSAPRAPAGRPAQKKSARPAAPGRPVAVGPMRLQRALARAGVASRRAAEEMITAGRVTVNGTVAVLGQTVDPARDRVLLDGAPVAAPVAAEWFVLHKPAGVMTTRDDPEGRRTVFDLVPKRPGLTYVGRLDLMTEGVLLLTTDGEAAHKLTHPSREVERTYVALVRGNAPAAVRAVRQGVELEDGMVRAVSADAYALGGRRWEFEITLTEGRTREVRRVCEVLGLEVERLVRISFGPIRIGDLPVGQARPLTATELRALDALARMPAVPRDTRFADD